MPEATRERRRAPARRAPRVVSGAARRRPNPAIVAARALSLDPPRLAANPRRRSRSSADRRLSKGSTLRVRRRSTLDRAGSRDSSTIIGGSRLSPAAVLVAVAVAVALGAAAPAQALVVGLADQQATSFSDPKLTALPIGHARLSVAWDAMDYRWQRQELDAYMRATAAANIKVLVTFGRSRTRVFSLPPTRRYAGVERLTPVGVLPSRGSDQHRHATVVPCRFRGNDGASAGGS